MAISKIILNGVTQMDVTGKTVTSADMLSGVTALKNDGTDITGSISAMTLPSASSSTSSGTSKATITPTSSAQYLNIPAGYLDTAQFYTIAAASGGASNVVTGAFKGTTTGVAMDVNLSYTGSGYPIAVLIYPSEGAYKADGSYGILIQNRAFSVYTIVKNNMASTPTYSGNGAENKASVNTRYKSSTSSANTFSSAGASDNTAFSDSDAGSGSTNGVKIRSKTKLSVLIASSSYGFAANIEYRYWVIYSS